MPINIKLPKEINPKIDDGVLELYIKTDNASKLFPNRKSSTNDQSLFSFKEIIIINQKHPVVVDGVVKVPTPAAIKIAKEKIYLIVGKNRGF